MSLDLSVLKSSNGDVWFMDTPVMVTVRSVWVSSGWAGVSEPESRQRAIKTIYTLKQTQTHKEHKQTRHIDVGQWTDYCAVYQFYVFSLWCCVSFKASECWCGLCDTPVMIAGGSVTCVSSGWAVELTVDSEQRAITLLTHFKQTQTQLKPK